jgi:hypothetical protein
MQGFFAKAKTIGSEFARVRTEEFFKLQAERHLKEKAVEICEGLGPEQIEKMVAMDLHLADLLRETGYQVPKVAPYARPAVSYLQSRTDEEMLAILDQVVPAQVAILRKYPHFAHHIIEDLKALGGG